jgi:hypothetical protein
MDECNLLENNGVLGTSLMSVALSLMLLSTARISAMLPQNGHRSSFRLHIVCPSMLSSGTSRFLLRVVHNGELLRIGFSEDEAAVSIRRFS